MVELARIRALRETELYGNTLAEDYSLVVTGATDMRKGFDGLYGIVANRLGLDPTSGHLFVFCNAARNRIKVLLWDGSGLWVCTKRLEQGRFRWDWDASQSSATIPIEQLSMLLGGVDLKQTQPNKTKKAQITCIFILNDLHTEKKSPREPMSDHPNFRKYRLGG